MYSHEYTHTHKHIPIFLIKNQNAKENWITVMASTCICLQTADILLLSIKQCKQRTHRNDERTACSGKLLIV